MISIWLADSFSWSLFFSRYYVCNLTEYIPPATLCEVLNEYSLPDNLQLSYFTAYNESEVIGYYSLNEDDEIWQILLECQDAKFVPDEGNGRISRERITFTATANTLGVYKRAFYISKDGYLSTNIFDWACTFYIGEEAASKIISYAKNKSETAEYEPYVYSLAGILTEIGDGYILVDDTVLCSDESDGMVFKVLTSDIRIRRCIEFQKIEEGSLVVISFTEPVNVSEGNVVYGAISMQRGYISGGAVSVME